MDRIPRFMHLASVKEPLTELRVKDLHEGGKAVGGARGVAAASRDQHTREDMEVQNTPEWQAARGHGRKGHLTTRPQHQTSHLSLVAKDSMLEASNMERKRRRKRDKNQAEDALT